MLSLILSPLAGLPQSLDLPPPSSTQLAEVRDLLARGHSWDAIRTLRRQPLTPETHLWLALAYFMAEQYKLFEQAMSEAARSFPESPFPPYALGRYVMDVRQQADRAQPFFEESLRRSPSYAPALYHLGWCHELAGDTGRAVELYRQAEGYWLAHLGLARAALSAGDLNPARRHARRAVILRPEAAMAHLLYARVLERSGQLAEALEEFERAANLDPTDSRALYQAMRCARRLNQPRRVNALLNRYRTVVAVYGTAH
jgi:tetratricopeptide (TPR) repeat protein